jgi:hypothetical protein
VVQGKHAAVLESHTQAFAAGEERMLNTEAKLEDAVEIGDGE